jgi:hypothetical protein
MKSCLFSAYYVDRILRPPPDEMRFDVVESEFFREVAGYVFSIQIFPAGIDINTHKLAVRESVDADVRFHNHHKTAPAAGVFDAVVIGFIHHRLAKDIHADFLGKFFEALQNQFLVIEFFEIAAITVQREMLAEIAEFFVFSFENICQHFFN